MLESHVRNNAFSMPFSSPAFTCGPYRFINREYLVVSYETDIDALREIVPEPLEVRDPIVNFEFMRMPDSTGFGDYTEAGQVIPVHYDGKQGNYVHAMYLDSEAPIAGGREIWGFPKSLAHRSSLSRATPCLELWTTGRCASQQPPWGSSIVRPILLSFNKPCPHRTTS